MAIATFTTSRAISDRVLFRRGTKRSKTKSKAKIAAATSGMKIMFTANLLFLKE
jgi:hypothetical protein